MPTLRVFQKKYFYGANMTLRFPATKAYVLNQRTKTFFQKPLDFLWHDYYNLIVAQKVEVI